MKGVRDMRARGNTVGADRRRLWRGVMAALAGLAICLSFLQVPIAARAEPSDLREFLSRPEAMGGDGVHRLGLRLSPEADYPSTPRAPALMTGTPLAASADISSQMPPVGDQGQQGSCVAWAASYYYKSWSERQEHGWSLTDPMHQYSPSFVYNQINGGQDQGSTFDDAFALMQTKGDVDIAEFPYNQNNYTDQPSAMELQAAKQYRIPSGWTSFWTRSNYGPYSPANDITNAKGWLASGQPLVLGIPIYNDWPDYGYNASKSYYDYNGTSTIAGGHGVCIVGYDDNANPQGTDADHRGGFKMVNSWGASWNGNGFVWLSYDFVKRYVWEAWTMGNISPDTPAVSSLSRASGNPGDTVEVNGNNFGGLRRNARVAFNGTSATASSWTNEKVTVSVPAGATSGALVVYDWEGVASNGVAFTVGGTQGGPVVTGVSPAEAAGTGPVSLEVSGTGFVSGCTFKLSRSGSADIGATGVSFGGSTRVEGTVDINGAAQGSWDVVVTNPGGATGALSGGFRVTGDDPATGDTYEPNDSAETAYGPLASGEAYGSYIWEEGDLDYFSVEVAEGAPALTVDLTSVPEGCDYDLYVYDSDMYLVDYSYNSYSYDEQVVIRGPRAGTYYLEVESYTGSSQEQPYALVASFEGGALPTISSLSPGAGTPGAVVTLRGSGFGAVRGSSYVAFGAARVASTGYVAWADGEIRCRVPSSASGRTSIAVTTEGGTSNGVGFSVVPAIGTVSPTSGRAGAMVTITGKGFGSWSSGQTLVYFGRTRATQYYRWENGRIMVRVPRAYPGRVALTVRTAGGTSSAKPFTILR